jgi:hypothetical protein
VPPSTAAPARVAEPTRSRFDVLGEEHAPVATPGDPAGRLGLFEALAPLVTNVFGANTEESDASFTEATDSDPFQALVADIAIERSREESTPQGDRHRRALLRAVAELAETHAVAADLACETTAIDLPIDIPDLVVEPVASATDDAVDGAPMLIVPDMIRTCRDRLAAHTSDADRTKIDIVATLFDHVLADDRLATGVRNTLARLQLPVLRMALADESFYLSRTHPTRRLLARLAASAAEWRDDTPSARAGLAALERIVHTVIRGSFEDAGEHARLLEQFEHMVIDIATAASAAQAAPVEPVLESEDRDVLVIKATIQISQLLAGVEVDRAVRYFLLDVWARVLVEIACRAPDSGRDALLARAKRLCFDLAWTAMPKTTSGERARLAGLLPTMIAAIRDGLAVIDYPADDEKRFFADWTRVLMHAVRGAPGAPFRGGDYGIDGLTIDAFARRLREGSFGPETIVGAASGASALPPPGLRTADDVTPSMLRGPSTAAGDRAGEHTLAPIVIGELAKGEWFEMRTSDQSGDRFVRVRLSWVSPLRSFYLFIGASSTLTRSLDPETIEALIARGDLRRAAMRKDD